jgi:hypothetical protein
MALADLGKDYILVVSKTDNRLLNAMKKAAIVVEDDNPASHAVTVGLALDIPVMPNGGPSPDRDQEPTIGPACSTSQSSQALNRAMISRSRWSGMAG